MKTVEEQKIEINPRFVISADSLTVAQRLREVPPNGICLYSDLSTLIQKNVQKEARTCLTTARRLLQREEQMLFAPIRAQGLKRLVDEDIARLGSATIRQINRASHRGTHKLVCIKDFTSLSQDAQIRHNTAMSLLGVFYEVSKAKSVHRIEGVVAQLRQKLPLKDTLLALMSST